MDDGADPATVADRPEPLDTPIEDVHRIEFSVEWPPGHVAAYLLDGPEPLLIDAGMTGEQAYEELEEGLARAGYDTADVAHLVVTHPHVDHIGQVPAVIEAADPLVYAPAGVRDRLARDAEALASAVERNATAAGIVGERRERSVEMAVRSLERNRDLLAPSNVDCWIGDGNGRGANGTEERQESQKGKKSAKHERDERSGKDEESEPDAITVGGVPFEAIATPGHQADHLCFETAMDGERVLFAGDTALAPFRPVLLQVGLDEGVERGLPAFEGSLDRLSARSIDRASGLGRRTRLRGGSGRCSHSSAAMSSGNSMCVAPGFSCSASLNAFRIDSWMISGSVTRAFHFETGSNMSTISRCWWLSLCRRSSPPWPVIATNGLLSRWASATPVRRFVAPGPKVLRQTPASPVSRP